MRQILQRMSVSAILVMIVALPALAQNTVTLEGSVKSAGAPVPGAQVTVVNAATTPIPIAQPRTVLMDAPPRLRGPGWPWVRQPVYPKWGV